MAEETTPPSDAQDTKPQSDDRTAKEFHDVADALRNRVDLFGKTLAAVATLGTTAVGLSKIGAPGVTAGMTAAYTIFVSNNGPS